MRYLVTYFPPPKNSGINVLQSDRFDELSDAKDCAENALRSGSTSVELWKLEATPKALTVVEW